MGRLDAVRMAAPISEDGTTGKFELLVKRHDDGDATVAAWPAARHQGGLQAHQPRCAALGDESPFVGKRSVSLVCTGGGVAACYRALQQIFGGAVGGGGGGEAPRVVLICGNKTPDDILLRDELSAWVVRAGGAEAPARPRRRLACGRAAARRVEVDAGVCASGVVDAEKLRTHLYAPADDTLVLVATDRAAELAQLCGPRGARGAAGVVSARAGLQRRDGRQAVMTRTRGGKGGREEGAEGTEYKDLLGARGGRETDGERRAPVCAHGGGASLLA